MNRREFLATVTLSFLAQPFAAEGQQSAKVPGIGLLSTGTRGEGAPRLEAFRQGLRDVGYVDGQTIAIEYRWAEGRMERLQALARELVNLKVDVIVAPTSPAALAAKDATRTIPIVFVTAAEPVDYGLKTAKALGLTIPQAVLARADEVIE